jgi:hypothetical protein
MKKYFLFVIIIIISNSAECQISPSKNTTIESELNNIFKIIIPLNLVKDVRIICNKNQDYTISEKSKQFKCDSLINIILIENNVSIIDTIYNSFNLNQAFLNIKFLDNNLNIDSNSLYINKIFKKNDILYFHIMTHFRNHYNEFVISRNIKSYIYNTICEYSEMQ